MGCLKNYCSVGCWNSLVCSRDLWLESTKLQVFFLLLTNNNNNNNNNKNNNNMIIIMTTTTIIIIIIIIIIGLLITLKIGGCSFLHYFILLRYLVLLKLYILIYQRLLTRFYMLIFFTNLNVMNFLARRLTLFLCNSLLRN